MIDRGRIRSLLALVFCFLSFFAWEASGQDRLPTVGDLISVQFPLATSEWVVVDDGENWEVVSRVGGVVTIRSFRPGTFEVRGTIRSAEGGERTEVRSVTVASVLEENDSMEPAPLNEPLPIPGSRVAWFAIGLAGVAVLLVWVPLLRESRRASGEPDAPPGLAPWDELNKSLRLISDMAPSDRRLIELANATRRYMARVEPGLGSELTSLEVLESLHARMIPAPVITIVREILDEGDYAKFAPDGGRAYRYGELAPFVSRIGEIGKAADS